MPGSRSGTPRPCRRPGSRRPGSAKPMRDRSTLLAARAAIRSMHSSTADSIPRPRRSIFTKPASAQESLSHWQIWRPGKAAGTTGTSSTSGRAPDHPPGVLGEVPRQAGGVAREDGQRPPARRGELGLAVGQPGELLLDRPRRRPGVRQPRRPSRSAGAGQARRPARGSPCGCGRWGRPPPGPRARRRSGRSPPRSAPPARRGGSRGRCRAPTPCRG